MSDPEKRKKYDEYGEHWKHADEFEKQKQQYGAGGFGGRTGGFGSSGNGSYWYSSNGEEGFGDAGGFGGNAGGFSDFFEELFGHRGAGAAADEVPDSGDRIIMPNCNCHCVRLP